MTGVTAEAWTEVASERQYVTMSQRSVTVGMVDDHQILLDGLTAWFAAHTDDVVVTIAVRTWAELTAHDSFPPRVVVLDLDGPDPLPRAVRIGALRLQGVATVALAADPDVALAQECIGAGAFGFVTKTEDAGVMLSAIRAAHRGETWIGAAVARNSGRGAGPGRVPKLSPQERRALVLYAGGLAVGDVAAQMDVGYESAKSYLVRAREKYAICGRAAHSKLDLHRRAVEDGLITGR